MNSQRYKLLSLRKPTLKQLQALPPSKIQKLPISLRLQLPPVNNWDAVKAFFWYSETLVLARAEAVIGLITVAAGTMDWSPLLGITNFDKKQILWLGGLSFAKGVFTELARRRNMLETPVVEIK